MEKNIYFKIYELLNKGENVVVARTIRREGSAPRSVGSMCIITQDGKTIGTIGGGLLEYKVANRAKEIFKEKVSTIYHFHLTSNDLAKAGMICGGDVDIFIEPLFFENKETLSLYKMINEHLLENKSGTLVTLIQDNIHAMDTGSKAFIRGDGTTHGNIKGFEENDINLDKTIFPALLKFGDHQSRIFAENIALDPEIIIFGAGHISTFLAPLSKMVGFDTIVIDDREEFANKENFPDAKKIIAQPFEESYTQLSPGKNSYIVIVTRGHLSDKDVLRYALGTDATYIGMIGSIPKKTAIYDDLLKEGFSKEALEKVHAPIGLKINAETPEEIAVSIVGEIISKMRSKNKLQKIE